jgi:hypothetical protein
LLLGLPFTKAHFGNGEYQPIVLTRIANVENVNRLVPIASLLLPQGSDDHLRPQRKRQERFRKDPTHTCRTRVENPVKLKVLADVYAHRHLVECCFSKLNQFRRVATRFEKTTRNYRSVVTLAAIVLWLR